MNDIEAKRALDLIIEGLGTGPHASAINDWFISAELLKQTIDLLQKLGIGYAKSLKWLSFIFAKIKEFGPDVATIVHNIVEQGKELFNQG